MYKTDGAVHASLSCLPCWSGIIPSLSALARKIGDGHFAIFDSVSKRLCISIEFGNSGIW